MFEFSRKESLSQSGKIAPFYLPYIDQDLYFHDIEQLENELSQERERNNELKDSIDRIVHELKASLGTMLLCQDESDQRMLQLSIETMNRQLSFLLLLARLETNVMDVQFKKIELRPLIYSSIKNNKHLLIYNHFEVKIDCPELLIYTDPEWLIYIFDQLILKFLKKDLLEATRVLERIVLPEWDFILSILCSISFLEQWKFFRFLVHIRSLRFICSTLLKFRGIKIGWYLESFFYRTFL